MGDTRTIHQELTALGTHSTFVGVVINVAFAAIKGTAGVLGHSYALIADAVESTLDIFSSVAVLGGLKIASIPPDKNHPYGHGKAEPLAAMVVAIVLMATAILLAVGSVHEILSVSHQAPAPFTLYILIGVVVIKELLYRFVINVGEKTGSTAVRADAWHHRSDALTSFAAMIGIGVSLILGPGYESADDWAALFASGIIVFNAYRLLRPALDEIMDATPSPEMENSVRKVAMMVKGVKGLDKCHVRKMGLYYCIDLHVVVDGSVSVRVGHQIAHQVKDEVKRSNPAVMDVFIHVEPDV